jgi:sRNA-binding carbon storage regulator CsrA
MSVKNDKKRHDGFLVITRKIGESVMIGTSLVVINRIKSKSSVVLSIQTDVDVEVRRIDAKKKEPTKE